MAIRWPVRGKNVTLKVWAIDQYIPVACLVTASIWITEAYDDTSTPDSGRYVTRAPVNRAEWGVNIETVTVLNDAVDNVYFTWQFFLELVRSNGVNIELVLTDTNGGTKVYRGFVYVPQSEISGTVGDFSRSSISLIGSGGIDFSGTVTPSTFNTMRIDFALATDGQTDFQNNVLIAKTVPDILYVHREGEDKYKVVTGVPTNREVQLDAVNGKLIFLNGSDAGQFVYCILRV